MLFSYRALAQQQKGMTLIEVLIASVILFMAIGLVSTAFQQSIMLQTKVSGSRDFYEISTLAKKRIEFELSQGVKEGKIEVDRSEVTWLAKLLKKKSFKDSVNVDTDEVLSGRGSMALYQVELKTEKRSDTFKLVIWNDEL